MHNQYVTFFVDRVHYKPLEQNQSSEGTMNQILCIEKRKSKLSDEPLFNLFF